MNCKYFTDQTIEWNNRKVVIVTNAELKMVLRHLIHRKENVMSFSKNGIFPGGLG
jgi:hypothetical protein